MKKLLFLFIIGLLALPAMAQTTTNVVRLNEFTRIFWLPNPEPDIKGYWAMMRQGTNIWKTFTTTTNAYAFEINPATTNGVYTFSVSAVNKKEVEGDASKNPITADLVKPPVPVDGLRIEGPLIIKFE